MKKNLVLLVSLFTTACFSQKIGVIAGVNNSFYTAGIGKSYYIEPSFGLQLGAFIEIDISKTVHLRPKVVYSEQGDRHRTKIEDYSTQQLNTIDYKLTYINVPIDFKFGNKVYAIAGPQVGFLIDKKQQNLFQSSVNSNIDVGFNLGGGFKVNQFFAEVGAYQGFSTMFRYYSGPSGNLVDVKNAAFKLTFGYYF